MADTPKRIKRLLREQGGRAHEEELRRALVPVAEAFKRWEHGELGSGWRYQAYVVAPLNAAKFNADEGIREGRQKGSQATLSLERF